MKRLLLLMCLPLLACTFNSCSDEKGDSGGGADSKFSIAGKECTVTKGYEIYCGDYYHTGTIENVDLILKFQDGSYLYIEMNVPRNSTKLVAGTYDLSSDYKALTYSYGYLSDQDDTNQPDITGGPITIAVANGVYTVTVDCTLENGDKVQGKYRGPLEWVDESDESDESYISVTPKSITALAGGDSQSVTVSSNGAWTLSGSAAWCRPSATSGQDGDVVTFEIDPNTSNKERPATYTFACGDKTAIVTITQEARPNDKIDFGDYEEENWN